MSTPIIKKFFNVFWQNKSCQNLFLLSKEELLESIYIGSGPNRYTYTTDRIIISNAQTDQDTIEKIKFRTESYDIDLSTSIEEKIEFLKPIAVDFLSTKYSKAIDKVQKDIEDQGWKLAIKLISILSNEKTREEKMIRLLQDYGFIGNNINSLESFNEHITKIFIPKKNNELVNEHTIRTFLEGVKFIKEVYVNHSYKNLYNTNQVLVNTLNSEDNFESRIKLFNILYDNQIIAPSKEDAFIECSICEPNTYKGTFQLRINPSKLKDLVCPICNGALTYFVPYTLHSDIYKIVKNHDGLLLEALANKLDTIGILYKLNKVYQEDIEIDCVFENESRMFFVETKMYKLNTSNQKLKNKIKRHFGKLVEDVTRITNDIEISLSIQPILLTNVNDNDLLNQINVELADKRKTPIKQNTLIVNLDNIKFNSGN